MTYLNIEEQLKTFLQRPIQIQVGEKIIREGKLILFNLKDYYLVLTMRIKGRFKLYEIPYPFATTLETEDRLVFDYRLSHLHNGDITLLKHRIFCTPKKSKFYNTIATIQVCPTI